MNEWSFPPKPPPTSMGTTLTFASGTPSAAATCSRMTKGAWVVVQMVTFPSAPGSAAQACGSM